VTLTVNTPFRLMPVGLPLVLGAGTPLIRTVEGIPGMSPVSVLPEATVAVTVPAVRVRELSAAEVERWVTSTALTIPEPPGDTYAM